MKGRKPGSGEFNKRILLRVNEDVYRQMQAEAFARGHTVAKFVRDAVMAQLDPQAYLQAVAQKSLDSLSENNRDLWEVHYLVMKETDQEAMRTLMDLNEDETKSVEERENESYKFMEQWRHKQGLSIPQVRELNEQLAKAWAREHGDPHES